MKPPYKGIIIEQSLADTTILDQFKVLNRTKTENLGWLIFTVESTPESIEALQKYMKEGSWYAHFWRNNESLLSFVIKLFTEEMRL